MQLISIIIKFAYFLFQFIPSQAVWKYWFVFGMQQIDSGI